MLGADVVMTEVDRDPGRDALQLDRAHSAL
jgi:hypothetical protein